MAFSDNGIISALDVDENFENTDLLMEEISISNNTTAAGGNASLMTID